MHSDSIYYTSLEEMAASYLQAIQAIAPHGPYLLGGWSFGSIVAFEMAQQLRQQGQEVALLAIIDGGAPELASENFRQADDTTLLAIITMELARDALSMSLQELYDELYHRDAQEQVQYVVDCLAKVDKELAQNGSEWVIQQKNLFLRRINLIRGYHARPYPGPITLFRAQSEDALEFEHGSFSQVHDMGWGSLSSLPLTIEHIPGYHDTLIVEPYVQLLAERLQLHIDQVLSKLRA
jgi:thioesterase domain-containing protein